MKFRCGHPKDATNSKPHKANGYIYPRCRECWNALQREEYRRRKR